MFPPTPGYVCTRTDFEVRTRASTTTTWPCQHADKLITANSQDPLDKIEGTVGGQSIRGVKVVVAQGWDFVRRRSLRRT
jgi:hypothetical protein